MTYNTTIKTKTILSAGLILMTIIFPISGINIVSAIKPDDIINDTKQCQQKLNEKFSEIAKLTDVEKAKRLANTDRYMQTIQDDNLEYFGLLHNWESDLDKCTTKLTSIDVVFTTVDKNDGQKYNINVNVDPELKTIKHTQKSKYEENWSTRNTANWAGYQITNGSPSLPVYEAQSNWVVRAAYQPYSGYCTTDKCKEGTWVGLSNDRNGNPKLVQAVQKAEVQCTSGTTCSATTYGAEIVFLGTGVGDCTSTLSIQPGDTISAYVTNKKKTGGAVDKWDVIIYRLRAGSATLNCASLNFTYSLGSGSSAEPIYASYITERATKTPGSTPVYYPLAKFDPISQQGTYWNGASYQSIRTQYDLGNFWKVTMKPGSVNWVTVSDPPTSGGTFTATWAASTG